MNDSRSLFVLTIVGPTASGKTEIAYKIAQLIKNENYREPRIVSADSRQVYRNIPIASSYPPAEYLNTFKHYFIGVLNPEDEFNAGMFGKSAREIILILTQQNKVPIIVGGSGLYLSSLIYGLFNYEEENEESGELKQKQKIIRQELVKRLKSEGLRNLFSELQTVDVESSEKMKNANHRRILRALEVYYLTGIPISIHQKRKIDVGFKAVQFGISWERKKLYERINKRVDFMIGKGLIEEIELLRSNGYNYKDYNSLNTVGVKEVFDYLDKKLSIEQMTELIKQNTRRFAKRQLTWFRKDKNIYWIEAGENNFSQIPEMILRLFNELYSYK
jgi:tRNA dimethylallyltransferase